MYHPYLPFNKLIGQLAAILVDKCKIAHPVIGLLLLKGECPPVVRKRVKMIVVPAKPGKKCGRRDKCNPGKQQPAFFAKFHSGSGFKDTGCWAGLSLTGLAGWYLLGTATPYLNTFFSDGT